jgi:hypothetical protein
VRAIPIRALVRTSLIVVQHVHLKRKPQLLQVALAARLPGLPPAPAQTPARLKKEFGDVLAFSRARAHTGNKIAARIAIIAITTNNSMSVKPLRPLLTSWPF